MGAAVAAGRYFNNFRTTWTETNFGGTRENYSLSVAPVDVATANLALTKNHTGNFQVGQAGTYELTATNDGPNAAAGPAHRHRHAAHRVDLRFVERRRLVVHAERCNGHLHQPCRSRQWRVVRVQSGRPVGPTAAASVTNSAVVSSPTFDPVPANNTDDDPTTIVPVADLSIEKTRADTAPGRHRVHPRRHQRRPVGRRGADHRHRRAARGYHA